MLNQRYNRNISVDKIGEDGQKKLLSSKVLVAGSGGLGSTVIMNLAAVGIGTIGIVDFDTVELSNFNRQYIHKFSNIGRLKTDSASEWVKDFNQDTKINTYNIKLDENNYHNIVKDYDVIVDCFDSYETKFLLNDIALKENKTLIHAGVTGFNAQVMTIIPYQSACLRCLIPDADVKTKIEKGTLSPVVAMTASIQAIETVKVLLNFEEILTNKILIIDALNMSFQTAKLTKDNNCKLCGKV